MQACATVGELVVGSFVGALVVGSFVGVSVAVADGDEEGDSLGNTHSHTGPGVGASEVGGLKTGAFVGSAVGALEVGGLDIGALVIGAEHSFRPPPKLIHWDPEQQEPFLPPHASPGPWHA